MSMLAAFIILFNYRKLMELRSYGVNELSH